MEVDTQPPEASAAVRTDMLGPPQHRLNACHQLPGLEWFGKIIVGTEFQTDHLVHQFSPGGEHDDGDRTGLPHPFADIETGHPREHHVQDDQIRIRRPDFF